MLNPDPKTAKLANVKPCKDRHGNKGRTRYIECTEGVVQGRDMTATAGISSILQNITKWEPTLEYVF